MEIISEPDPPEVREQLWRDVGGGTAWDIGANCGQLVLRMLSRFDRVLAFEPAAESFSIMARVFRDNPAVECYPLAVAAHSGFVMLAELPSQIETGQLVMPGLQGMEWEPEDWSVVPQRKVEARSVDTLAATYGTPDFIKVDTEGHEADILEGAHVVLSQERPAWLIEFHSLENWEICTTSLSLYGYRVTTVRHPHYAVSDPMWRRHGWLRAFHPEGR